MDFNEKNRDFNNTNLFLGFRIWLHCLVPQTASCWKETPAAGEEEYSVNLSHEGENPLLGVVNHRNAWFGLNEDSYLNFTQSKDPGWQAVIIFDVQLGEHHVALKFKHHKTFFYLYLGLKICFNRSDAVNLTHLIF